MSASIMSVPIAYGIVILVWSTTPLAIHLSNDSVSFIMAVGSRMLIGALLATSLNRLLGLPLPFKGMWRGYLAGALGFFAAMSSVYWAAQFIESGLIAVVYGTAPLISGLLAWLIIGEKSLTPLRVVMLLVAIAGLGVIFQGELAAQASQGDAIKLAKGIGGVLLSTVLFCLSAVLIKKEQMAGRTPGHPLTQTAGALLCTAPAYILLWLLVDAKIPTDITLTSLFAIGYLGVFGSVLGFLCYFYILQKLTAEKVALITLVTPILALALGYFAANEPITWSTVLGTSIILLALVIYQRAGRTIKPVPAAPNMPHEKE